MAVRRLFSMLSVACITLFSGGCPIGGAPIVVTQDILDKEIAAFNAVNTQRTSNGLQALVMNETLREVARKHSQDMFTRNFFDHVNPDGKDPGARITAANVGFTSAAENIAWNNFPNPVETAVTGWMNSNGHRANILTSNFTQTGMGVASDNNGGFYFTQVFIGTSKSNVIVVYYDVPIVMSTGD